MTIEEAKSRFENILLRFQKISSQDTVEKFVFLLDPKERLLCKGLVAWKNIKTELDFSEPKEIENETDFIWQFSRFDLKNFCAILQIEPLEAKNLINRLKGLHLIFPDGTVNQAAYGVMLTYVSKDLAKRTGANKKTETKIEDKR